MFSSGFLMMAPAFARSLLAQRLRGSPWKIEPIYYTPASRQFARTGSERTCFAIVCGRDGTSITFWTVERA
jgi:hypothetical protein